MEPLERLNAMERRRKLKLALRVDGLTLAVMGLMILPRNIEALTRGAVGAFKTIADVGGFGA